MNTQDIDGEVRYMNRADRTLAAISDLSTDDIPYDFWQWCMYSDDITPEDAAELASQNYS